MADLSSSLFNKKATEKLRNPDDLDKYVRVTNPSVWVVIAACVFLLAGLLVWAVFGSVTTSVSAMGSVVTMKKTGEPAALCFLNTDDAAKVHQGDVANVNGEQMKVQSVDKIPVSAEEANTLLQSDYLVSALVKDDWAYTAYLEGDISGLPENVPLTVSIIVERVPPISLILKNWG